MIFPYFGENFVQQVLALVPNVVFKLFFLIIHKQNTFYDRWGGQTAQKFWKIDTLFNNILTWILWMLDSWMFWLWRQFAKIRASVNMVISFGLPSIIICIVGYYYYLSNNPTSVKHTLKPSQMHMQLRSMCMFVIRRTAFTFKHNV